MTKKIKLIFLINEISDGGAETLVKDYVLNLDKNSFDVSVVTDMRSDVYSANYHFLKEKKIKIYCPFLNIYDNTWVKKIISRLIQILLFHIPEKWKEKYQFWYVRHKIKKINPDVIHAHLIVLKYLASCSKRLRNVKLFYTCHSLPYRYFNTSERKDNLNAAKYLIKNNSLTLVALHGDMQNELNKLFNIDSTIVIHNGVDLKRFYNVKRNESKDRLRKKNHIPSGAFVIGNIGRFIWIKNHKFIIDVFIEISKKKPNSFLLMIGNGYTSEIIQKLESNGLSGRYLILSNSRDIPELLLCMDVFLFPSLFEGFPLACIEAQAMDLKCCISDTINRDVFLGHNAIPISLSDSAEQWTQKILDDKIQGPYNGNIEEFDIQTIVKKLSTLYRQKVSLPNA